jgi:transposase
MPESKDSEASEVEVLPAPRRAANRRVFSAAEKRAFVEETYQPGGSVSLVARKYKLSSSLLFRWRKLMEDGSMSGLGADEPVVPESELKEAKVRIRELERLLGKKTLEVEILKDAVEIARSKKLISRSLLPSKSRGDR